MKCGATKKNGPFRTRHECNREREHAGFCRCDKTILNGVCGFRWKKKTGGPK